VPAGDRPSFNAGADRAANAIAWSYTATSDNTGVVQRRLAYVLEVEPNDPDGLRLKLLRRPNHILAVGPDRLPRANRRLWNLRERSREYLEMRGKRSGMSAYRRYKLWAESEYDILE
jgi:hypothetical protein